VRQIETILAESKSEPDVQAIGLEELALLSTMRGEFDEARRFAAEARSIYGEFGLKLQRASATIVRGWTHLIEQDLEAAEHELRVGYDALDQMGEKSILSGVAIVLAETLYRQGRLPEAEEWARIGEDAAASDDVLAQIGWRGVTAKVLAQRGLASEAAALAREGADLAARTDWLTTQGDALMDQASVVITLGGGRGEAAAILERAMALYEQKGNSVSAAQARALLEKLC
jgi:hypothetical protein